MPKYDVLTSFTDTKDEKAKNGENVYWAGQSKYPRDGYSPDQKRIAELQGEDNALKKPIIGKTAAADDEKAAEPAGAAPQAANNKDK